MSTGHFGTSTEMSRVQSVLGPKCPCTVVQLHTPTKWQSIHWFITYSVCETCCVSSFSLLRSQKSHIKWQI